MHQLTVHFRQKLYKGTIYVSREKLPYFYWCFFDDLEIIDELGECIGFVEKDNELKPTAFFPQQYQSLVDTIKNFILENILKTKRAYIS